MTQTAFLTKWKFVVEFEDEETNEISGTIGQADTREECEGFLNTRWSTIAPMDEPSSTRRQPRYAPSVRAKGKSQMETAGRSFATPVVAALARSQT